MGLRDIIYIRDTKKPRKNPFATSKMDYFQKQQQYPGRFQVEGEEPSQDAEIPKIEVKKIKPIKVEEVTKVSVPKKERKRRK